jgi:hypothetical protein
VNGRRREEAEEGAKEVERAIKEGQEIVPCLISWYDMGRVQHAVLNTSHHKGQLRTEPDRLSR